MAISTEEAARILVHYINLALPDLSSDSRQELQCVIEAFSSADAALHELRVAEPK